MRQSPRVLAHNRTTLLRLIRDHGPLPRVELAARSGLSPTTVTRAMGELLDAGYVAEVDGDHGGTRGGRVGRPAIDVALVPSARFVCAVQVGVGTAGVAVCDLLAHVVAEDTVGFGRDDPPEAVLDAIVAGLESLLERARIPSERLVGVGVGAPGPVDRAQRVNLLSINLGWRDVPFSDRLERALGVPTVVDHNVRAMAVAEALYGVGRDANTLAFVYSKSGVGAGLVVDGQPYRGGTHGVTELGHLRVVGGDRPCACGSTGCLETVASEGYVSERAAELAAADPDGPLAAAAAAGRSPLQALPAAAEAGDPGAVAILDEVARHLATALASLVNLINTELIVLGGFFSDAGDPLLRPLREELRRQAFPVLRDSVRVERTSFGRLVGVVGAAAVALDRFVYGTPIGLTLKEEHLRTEIAP